MTEQEAVERLRFLPTPMFDNETDEAKRMAIKALEKQIPKKPSVCVDFRQSMFICPSCGRKQSIMYEQYHCKECGQKLNWEEV